ncbi:Uncharacterised protein [uncultured archaeon]|nr:Uncharacterised protein [uncultured archaeon]
MSRELLMREPALAMLMGALPQGDHFGHEQPNRVGFGDDYGYGFGLQSAFDPSMNVGMPGMGYGYGFGWIPQDAMGYGYGFGAPPAGPAAPPPHPALMHRQAMMHQQAMGHAAIHPSHPAHPQHAIHAAARWEMQNPTSTMARSALLDPNRDSTVKVERYSFSFSPPTNLVLGTASNIPTFTQQPSTTIKGQRVVMNAPVPGFILISTLQIANVNVLVGGTEDAFTYSAGAQGVMLDLPRLDPQNRATSAGAYTGVLPPGYTSGASYQFIVTLQGPATLAGGYGQ